MGLTLSSTLDLYRLVRVPLAQRYSATQVDAEKVSLRDRVAALNPFNQLTFAPQAV